MNYFKDSEKNYNDGKFALSWVVAAILVSFSSSNVYSHIKHLVVWQIATHIQRKVICMSGLFFWVRISNMNESLDCRPWMLVQVWGWVGGGGVGGGNGGKGGVICLCARCCSLSCQIRVLHSQRCYMELHRKHSCNRLLLIYYSAARENSKDFLWPKILAISIWIDVKEKYAGGDENTNGRIVGL